MSKVVELLRDKACYYLDHTTEYYLSYHYRLYSHVGHTEIIFLQISFL